MNSVELESRPGQSPRTSIPAAPPLPGFLASGSNGIASAATSPTATPPVLADGATRELTAHRSWGLDGWMFFPASIAVPGTVAPQRTSGSFTPRFPSLLLLVGLMLALPPLSKAQAPGTEPTNAAEAAARKAAEDKAIEVRYQQWKDALSPERQAWEAVLAANLGPFYLPRHQKDKVDDVANAWDFVTDDPRLPRVLLIGDSISRGYTLPVRAALAGRANVHRAPENCGPTANGLKKLGVWLGVGNWDVIHFNFGIHDRATPEADYEARLEELVERLRRTRAKLIWASSTPLPAESTYGSDAAMVTRNAIAARIMRRHGIPITDLYSHITPRLADFQRKNDVHFSDPGYEYLGAEVARVIGGMLGP